MSTSTPGRDEAVAEVRARADIAEIVGEHVVLKRQGRKLLGLCPFHQERTPSFNVDPERGFFHCFGCGEGGDVFTFLMKHTRLTFPEALDQLAGRYGVVLPQRRAEDDERVAIRQANEAAAAFFRTTLAGPDGAGARAYLADRGVAAESIAQFAVGLSPGGWDGLVTALSRQGFTPEVLERAALARPRQSGGHYDYFRNRLMFPITNEAGHVLGFGARALLPADEPKYLNSPETPLYHKGQILYGLNQARDAIRAKDGAILVEGYMDVIAAHAHGFTQTVGVLGTALTATQARVLLRHTPSRRIVIAFDADRAGQQAAEKGIAVLAEVAQGVGLQARVLSVPEGKDPDAYLRQQGAEAFNNLLIAAPDVIQFQLERAIAREDVQTPEGRARAVAHAVPILRNIGNYVTQDYYVTWISRRLALREESIRLEIGRGLRHNVAPSRSGRVQVKTLSTREAQRVLLYMMVEKPAVSGLVRERLGEMPFGVIEEELRTATESLISTRGAATWADLQGVFQDREEITKAISEMMFADYERWPAEDLVEDCTNTLLYNHGQQQVAMLSERLKRDADTLDSAAIRAMVERMAEWEQYCRGLRKRQL